MLRRLCRWIKRLSSMEPQTMAGLAAKAAASLAVRDGDKYDLHSKGIARAVQFDVVRLGRAVGDDALRIIGADAGARAEQDRQADAELFHHGRRWEAASLELRTIERDTEAAWHCFIAIEPAIPGEMYVTDRDDRRVLPYARPKGPAHRMWYGDSEALEMLRAGYPKHLSEERRAEILAANERWRSDCAAAHRKTLCVHFEAAEDAAVTRENETRRMLLLTPAHTLEGLLLKARAALTVWDRADDGIEALRRRLKKALKDGDATDEAAMAVLLDLANLSVARPAPAVVPLDFIEIPAGRYPAETPREVIETYRTFLELELNDLNHEVYGRHSGRMHYWHDNPAARLHRPGGPEASSRRRRRARPARADAGRGP